MTVAETTEAPVLPRAVEDLVGDISAAVEAEERRGEAINAEEQSQESLSRMRSKIEAAIRRALAKGGVEAFEPFMHFGDAHYVRNLVAATDAFELLVLCWRPGQGSRVHNHERSHGLVTPLRGRVEEIRYANPQADPAEGDGAAAPVPLPPLPGVLSAVSPCPPLVEIGRGTAGGVVPGGPPTAPPTLYINDSVALHAVRCADDTDWELGAATLHLYLPPIRRARLYEPEADRVVERVPGVFSKGGVQLQRQA